MRQVVSEFAGMVLIAVFCAAIVLPLAAARDADEAPAEAPVPEKISAVQLLRQQHQDELTDWQVLQLAIAYTESRFNPAAVGKAQDSGILQITPAYVAEVNRLYGTDYALQDAFDIDMALELFALLQDKKNPAHDIDTAIYYHNKSDAYRRAVRKNMEFIRSYEAVRAAITH